MVNDDNLLKEAGTFLYLIIDLKQMLGCFHDITTLQKKKRNSFHFFEDFRRQSIRSTGSFTMPVDVYRAYWEANS